MNNPNEHVAFSIANNYMTDRMEYEKSRQMLKSIEKKKPSRFTCAICHTLVNLGHLLVAFGRRLERFELVLREGQA